MRSGLTNLPLLPTTSCLAFVLIVLIIGMLAFRILQNPVNPELALISSKVTC